MRIFLDTNVMLDYITNRAAFGEDAEAVIEFCRMDGNEGTFSSLSACDAVYILGRAVGRRYQYAADGEYSDLLILPWKSHKVGSPTIEFKCPQCFEEQNVSARYADVMLFNGVVKFAGDRFLRHLRLLGMLPLLAPPPSRMCDLNEAESARS